MQGGLDPSVSSTAIPVSARKSICGVGRPSCCGAHIMEERMTAIRVVLIGIASLSILACAKPTTTTIGPPGPTPSPLGADFYVYSYGGLRGAYAAILAETSCQKVQADFTTAARNWDQKSLDAPWGQMQAATQRARELACPELHP
jgi:hypothetical protein